MVTLRQLHYLDALADTLHFGRAQHADQGARRRVLQASGDEDCQNTDTLALFQPRSGCSVGLC